MAYGTIRWPNDRIMMLGKTVIFYSQGKTWEEIKDQLNCTEYELRIFKSKIKACVNRDWTE